MRKLIIIPAILLSVNLIFAQAETNKYGKDITLKKETKISDILENPQNYLDKTVLVEGRVLDVCPMAGCWVEISSENKAEKIKVKVKDGEIVFPQEAKGKTAKVEGTVYKIELSKEDAIDYYKHQAEEKGEMFDSTKVTAPVTIYQIKGLGAEIN